MIQDGAAQLLQVRSPGAAGLLALTSPWSRFRLTRVLFLFSPSTTITTNQPAPVSPPLSSYDRLVDRLQVTFQLGLCAVQVPAGFLRALSQPGMESSAIAAASAFTATRSTNRIAPHHPSSYRG